MVTCADCDKRIGRDELVSASFNTDQQRSFFHKDCEHRNESLSKWKEEAPWAFRPTRLTVADWKHCGHRKHLGVWQSIFIARRDEDVWCPDCGLKIAKHENLTCPACSGPAVLLQAEPTRMVFNHGEPLYKLLLHCTEKGEETTAQAVISGYTPVTLMARKRGEERPKPHEAMMLKYSPKGDLKQGLTV